MDGFGMLTGLGWLGMLTMVLFWIGVLLLVVWGLSNLFAPQPRAVEPDALEILKRRYTQSVPGGEIGYEEFRQAREALREQTVGH